MRRLIFTAMLSVFALGAGAIAASATTLPVLDETPDGTVVQAAVKAKAGSCGTHMYWKSGKCVDARSKAPSSWMPW